MKMVLKIGFLVLVTVFSGNLMAQDSGGLTAKDSGDLTVQEDSQTGNNLVQYFNTELIHWTAKGLLYQNKNFSIKEALMQYPDSAEQYNLFKKKDRWGDILFWGGIALLVGGFIPVVATDENSVNYDRNTWIGMGVMAGGLILEYTGVFISISGTKNLRTAINLFNRHKIEEYR